MSRTPPAGRDDSRTASLSRELSEFLLELSIGVHRYAMYPPGHPSLLPAAENVIGRLGQIFATQRSLSIGVAMDQLIIEGVATDPKHPVLKELAGRLHGHQLGAISFSRGVEVAEVEELLLTLARDPEREGDPLGLRPSNLIPSWEHVRLFPLGYGELQLTETGEEDEAEQDRSTHLWIGLASAAMASEDPEGVSPSTGAEEVAESIKGHRREAAYDQVIVGYLLQLADELKSDEARESESVRRRVSTLIRELDQPTLDRLVQMGGDLEQRKKFVLDANQSLAVDSVIKILQAAASASQQTISSSLTRLLTKLSTHASSGPARVRTQADNALRENVEELLEGWELEDPNPDAYTLILDSMSQAAPIFASEDPGDEVGGITGAHRLCQMSLELNSWGPTVEHAATKLVDEGDLGFLIYLIDMAPEGSAASTRLRDFLASPTQLRRLLEGVDADEATLKMIVANMGEDAIPILLEALKESESRAIRRKVFDALAGSPADVGSAVMPHMEDQRWYVLRNLLALVQKLNKPPEGFSAAKFLEHEDPRVRREAFPLAVKEPGRHERALALGLADRDERLLRMALMEVQASIPEAIVPVLVNRVIHSDRPSDLKAMGVRALGASGSSLALEALLEVASSGKSILGRMKLATTSPEVLRALQVLSRRWSHDRRAREVTRLAQKSRDPKVRAAVSEEGGAR